MYVRSLTDDELVNATRDRVESALLVHLRRIARGELVDYRWDAWLDLARYVYWLAEQPPFEVP